MTTMTKTRERVKAEPGTLVFLDQHTAFATVRAADIGDLLFVSNFSAKDPDSPAPGKHGYQREPVATRFPKIGKYLKDEGGYPTPLAVSARVPLTEIDQFSALFAEGDHEEIHRLWGKAALSVIDGQHRKGGIEWALRESGGSWNPLIPLVVFFGTTFELETRLFDVINTTQKALPKALIEISKLDILDPELDSYAAQVRAIAGHVSRDKDSVWRGRVNLTGARVVKMPQGVAKMPTFEGLRRSTQSMFPAELLIKIDGGDAKTIVDTASTYAKAYWESVANVFPDAWNNQPVPGPDGEPIAPHYVFPGDLVGIAALALLGKDVITTAVDRADECDPLKTIETQVMALAGFDWARGDKNKMLDGVPAGFSGQRPLYERLLKIIVSANRKAAREAKADAQAAA